MVYVDTSVLVPLFLNEPHSEAVARWYAHEQGELVAAAWCIPEFASAIGIKQRTGAIDAQQAQGAWARFERMAAADLRLLPVDPTHFHRAAELVLDAASALRAGDAREVVGQLARVVVAGPGSAAGRYPVGNTGWARVPATLPMPVPAHLAAILGSAGTG